MMDKPDNKLIEQWAGLKTQLNFKFKDGKEKQGLIKGCYGLSVYADFGAKEKTVVTFNVLDEITEVEA